MKENICLREDKDHPPWLELLHPTADTGIRVRAATLKDLFARAAWGMFFLLTDIRRIKPLITQELFVSADDRAALLARWLGELNFIHQVERRLFCHFMVTDLSSRSLRATVSGESLTSDHPVHIEIKAVTYHNLKVRRAGRLWKAEVIFVV